MLRNGLMYMRISSHRFWNLGLLLSLGMALSCTSSTQEPRQTPLVVATTGMIADMVQNLVGEKLEVQGLMGPGVDPHLYKASQRDLKLLREASVIFYNGLHLEGKMGEVLESLSREKPVYAIAEVIPEGDLIRVDQAQGSFDPHIWFDVALWESCLPGVVEKLIQHFPEQATSFENRARAYQDSLYTLHKWVANELERIPQASRTMITAHDAFEYFGRAYGIEVRGLQGISTVAEFGLKDRKELADLIVEKQIKAVFVESSVPSKSLEAVVADCKQRGFNVEIGGTLYSDAMGQAGSPEGTYFGMVRWNVNTLVNGLK